LPAQNGLLRDNRYPASAACVRRTRVLPLTMSLNCCL